MYVPIINKPFGLLTIIMLTLSAQAACAQQPAAKVPGTYSSLEYSNESGDLHGLEIKIIPVDDRFQGAVLISEGEPQPMILVDVQIRGTSVSFSVPGESGMAWKFSGHITAKTLNGTISYDSGGVEKVVLLRRCGYWDR
jgi:hypothetical protein